MMHMRRSLIFFSLFLAGCSLTGDNFPPPTSTTPLVPAVVDDAIRFDAEHMAESYGISTEEALRQFYLMEEAGSVQAQLIEKEADTFAGMWIEHEPEFLIVVVFTRDGKKTIRPYLENTHLGGEIELRKVSVTYQELVAAEMQANQLVNELKLSLIATTSVNIQENRAEINIPDRDLLEDRLQETGLKIPEHVEVIVPEGDSEKEATPPVPSDIGIFFPQLTVSPTMIYAELGISTVILEGGCFRLENEGAESSLLIWPPSYYPRDNQGVIEVLNSNGEPVARTGELSCFSRAAGDANEAVDQFLVQPLPESCGAPYTLVGWMELANWEGRNRALMEAELVSMSENSFYIIRSKAPLQDWLAEQRDFSGKLKLGYAPRSRCLHLRDGGGLDIDFLLLWPPGTQACSDGGTTAVCDANGQVMARLGEEVHVRGSLTQESEDIREAVNNELPCDCVGGAYLVVSSIGGEE